jgi:hypothetical protein
VSNKRQEIWQALLQLGHVAVQQNDLGTTALDVPSRLQEESQLKAADLVVVLVEDDEHVVQPAMSICERAKALGIPANMVVIVPQRLRGQVANEALHELDDQHGAVYWYTDAEISNCGVLTDVLERVAARGLLRVFTKGASSGYSCIQRREATRQNNHSSPTYVPPLEHSSWIL